MDIRTLERGLRDGRKIPQVLARREFWDDSAVFRVELDLRGDDVRQHTAVVDDGDAGFVAGRFEGEEHRAYFLAGSAACAATLPAGLPCLS